MNLPTILLFLCSFLIVVFLFLETFFDIFLTTIPRPAGRYERIVTGLQKRRSWISDGMKATCSSLWRQF